MLALKTPKGLKDQSTPKSLKVSIKVNPKAEIPYNHDPLYTLDEVNLIYKENSKNQYIKSTELSQVVPKFSQNTLHNFGNQRRSQVRNRQDQQSFPTQLLSEDSYLPPYTEDFAQHDRISLGSKKPRLKESEFENSLSFTSRGNDISRLKCQNVNINELIPRNHFIQKTPRVNKKLLLREHYNLLQIIKHCRETLEQSIDVRTRTNIENQYFAASEKIAIIEKSLGYDHDHGKKITLTSNVDVSQESSQLSYQLENILRSPDKSLDRENSKRRHLKVGTRQRDVNSHQDEYTSRSHNSADGGRYGVSATAKRSIKPSTLEHTSGAYDYHPKNSKIRAQKKLLSNETIGFSPTRERTRLQNSFGNDCSEFCKEEIPSQSALQPNLPYSKTTQANHIPYNDRLSSTGQLSQTHHEKNKESWNSHSIRNSSRKLTRNTKKQQPPQTNLSKHQILSAALKLRKKYLSCKKQIKHARRKLEDRIMGEAEREKIEKVYFDVQIQSENIKSQLINFAKQLRCDLGKFFEILKLDQDDSDVSSSNVSTSYEKHDGRNKEIWQLSEDYQDIRENSSVYSYNSSIIDAYGEQLGSTDHDRYNRMRNFHNQQLDDQKFEDVDYNQNSLSTAEFHKLGNSFDILQDDHDSCEAAQNFATVFDSSNEVSNTNTKKYATENNLISTSVQTDAIGYWEEHKKQDMWSSQPNEEDSIENNPTVLYNQDEDFDHSKYFEDEDVELPLTNDIESAKNLDNLKKLREKRLAFFRKDLQSSVEPDAADVVEELQELNSVPLDFEKEFEPESQMQSSNAKSRDGGPKYSRDVIPRLLLPTTPGSVKQSVFGEVGSDSEDGFKSRFGRNPVIYDVSDITSQASGDDFQGMESNKSLVNSLLARHERESDINNNSLYGDQTDEDGSMFNMKLYDVDDFAPDEIEINQARKSFSLTKTKEYVSSSVDSLEIADLINRAKVTDNEDAFDDFNLSSSSVDSIQLPIREFQELDEQTQVYFESLPDNVDGISKNEEKSYKSILDINYKTLFPESYRVLEKRNISHELNSEFDSDSELNMKPMLPIGGENEAQKTEYSCEEIQEAVMFDQPRQKTESPTSLTDPESQLVVEEDDIKMSEVTEQQTAFIQDGGLFDVGESQMEEIETDAESHSRDSGERITEDTVDENMPATSLPIPNLQDAVKGGLISDESSQKFLDFVLDDEDMLTFSEDFGRTDDKDRKISHFVEEEFEELDETRPHEHVKVETMPDEDGLALSLKQSLDLLDELEAFEAMSNLEEETANVDDLIGVQSWPNDTEESFTKEVDSSIELDKIFSERKSTDLEQKGEKENLLQSEEDLLIDDSEFLENIPKLDLELLLNDEQIEKENEDISQKLSAMEDEKYLPRNDEHLSRREEEDLFCKEESPCTEEDLNLIYKEDCTVDEENLPSKEDEEYLQSKEDEEHFSSKENDEHLLSKQGEEHLSSREDEENWLSREDEEYLQRKEDEEHFSSKENEEHLLSKQGEEHLNSGEDEKHSKTKEDEEHLLHKEDRENAHTIMSKIEELDFEFSTEKSSETDTSDSSICSILLSPFKQDANCTKNTEIAFIEDEVEEVQLAEDLESSSVSIEDKERSSQEEDLTVELDDESRPKVLRNSSLDEKTDEDGTTESVKEESKKEDSEKEDSEKEEANFSEENSAGYQPAEDIIDVTFADEESSSFELEMLEDSEIKESDECINLAILEDNINLDDPIGIINTAVIEKLKHEKIDTAESIPPRPASDLRGEYHARLDLLSLPADLCDNLPLKLSSLSSSGSDSNFFLAFQEEEGGNYDLHDISPRTDSSLSERSSSDSETEIQFGQSFKHAEATKDSPNDNSVVSSHSKPDLELTDSNSTHNKNLDDGLKYTGTTLSAFSERENAEEWSDYDVIRQTIPSSFSDSENRPNFDHTFENRWFESVGLESKNKQGKPISSPESVGNCEKPAVGYKEDDTNLVKDDGEITMSSMNDIKKSNNGDFVSETGMHDPKSSDTEDVGSIDIEKQPAELHEVSNNKLRLGPKFDNEEENKERLSEQLEDMFGIEGFSEMSSCDNSFLTDNELEKDGDSTPRKGKELIETKLSHGDKAGGKVEGSSKQRDMKIDYINDTEILSGSKKEEQFHANFLDEENTTDDLLSKNLMQSSSPDRLINKLNEIELSTIKTGFLMEDEELEEFEEFELMFENEIEAGNGSDLSLDDLEIKHKTKQTISNTTEDDSKHSVVYIIAGNQQTEAENSDFNIETGEDVETYFSQNGQDVSNKTRKMRSYMVNENNNNEHEEESNPVIYGVQKGLIQQQRDEDESDADCLVNINKNDQLEISVKKETEDLPAEINTELKNLEETSLSADEISITHSLHDSHFQKIPAVVPINKESQDKTTRTEMESTIAVSSEILDLSVPVVIDNGSGYTKAGLALGENPSVVIPAIIGRPNYEQIMHDSNAKEFYVGEEAERYRGVLKLSYPLEHGIVANWDDMEKLWDHILQQQLRIDPTEHPVLLTEAPLNPKKNRERMLEIMMETYQVPAFYIAIQAVMSLYVTGKTTGIVLDSGDGVTHIVPVYEGYSLPHATERMDIAGRDLTEYLMRIFTERGYSFTTSAEKEICKDAKEKLCFVAGNFEESMQMFESSSNQMKSYMLPDGQVVSVGNEQFRCPEILFQPGLIGKDIPGVHEYLYKSIQKCDVDLRSELYSNIVLSGGTTMLEGIDKRLKTELGRLSTNRMNEITKVHSLAARRFSVWCGAAALASMPTFSRMWITSDDYYDCGVDIVHRKCF